MALYEMTSEALTPITRSGFDDLGVLERRDLQRLLREHVEVISPDTLIIAEEYGNWQDSRRRIDLLGIDTDGNLVVIELKRDETGAHMELQALRYAAMVAEMTFEQAVQTLSDSGHIPLEVAESTILEFLEIDEPDEERFAQDVRIVLASGEFSNELATSVLWLNEHGLDIRCVRMHAYQFNGRNLVDVQQAIPLPEAAEFQVKIREKSERIRGARAQHVDFTRYDLDVAGAHYAAQPKRRLIFLIVRRAIESVGASPEEIRKLVGKNPWAIAEGTFTDRDEFTRAITLQYGEVNRPFDARRWFSENDELFQIQGRTYAFTKMWGGGEVLRAAENIQLRYPELSIKVVPSD